MPVFASEGDTVRVYRFQMYDIVSNEFVTSTRYAKKETIDKLGGRVASVAFDVPATHVNNDGFTEKDYIPIQGTSL